MAIFDPKSRYQTRKAHLQPYPAVDRRGRAVMAIPMAEPGPQAPIGQYIRKEGQRLDHLAGAFLNDPNGYWRIAEVNGAVLPDALADAPRVKVPGPIR
jgi:hypothetical protein